MRRSLRQAPLWAFMLLAACDAPTAPAPAETYDFALQIEPPLVFHWPLGATVRVHVEGAPGPLDTAAGRALDAWNRAVLLGEYRLVRTASLSDADVLVRWREAPPAVASPDPQRCSILVGRAVTTFCPDAALERLLVFPAVQGGGGRVRMIVSIAGSEAADPERLTALVSHEIGHALGIFNHPDPRAFPSSVMLSTPGSVLPSAADRATIRALYHTPSDMRP